MIADLLNRTLDDSKLSENNDDTRLTEQRNRWQQTNWTEQQIILDLQNTRWWQTYWKEH